MREAETQRGGEERRVKGYHEQRHRSLAHRLASLVNETDCGEKKEKKKPGQLENAWFVQESATTSIYLSI